MSRHVNSPGNTERTLARRNRPRAVASRNEQTNGPGRDEVSIPAFFGIPVEPEYYNNVGESYPEEPMSIDTVIIWSILIVVQACFWRFVIAGKLPTIAQLLSTSFFNLLLWWITMLFTTTRSGPKGYHFVLWMLGTMTAFSVTRMSS